MSDASADDSNSSNARRQYDAEELRGYVDAIRRSHGVAAFNMDGTIMDVNPLLLRSLGYQLEEVRGKHHRIFLTPEDATSQEYLHFWDRLRQGEFQTAEFKRLSKTRTEVWLQATYTPILDPSTGKPERVIKIATDVTEQKMRNADFHGQIDAIHRSHAVAVFSMEGYVIDANNIFLDSMGYSLPEIQGRHHRMFVPKEEANSKEYQQFWDTLNRGEYQTAEFRRIGNGGREVWLQAVYSPILNASGRPYKVVKMAMDVTEQKRRLAEVDRGKAMFLANMSHEIRTPMNGIFGMLSLLKDTQLDKTGRSYVDTCMRSAESLLAVLNDILLFSKANAGAIELEQTPFNLNNTVEDVLHIVSSNVTSAQDIDVTYFIKTDVPMFLVGDESRLRQVLMNLLSNAVKFTKYGEVSLDIALQSKNPLVVRFDVSDTGIGISEHDQERLFKPFSQADATITRQYGGTGLGLAICKHLVQLFGGELAVQSRMGRGSTFSFTAKFGVDNTRRDSLAAALDASEVDFSLLKNLRVLIVDDNATNCIALESTMKHFGCQVWSARSGLDGIDMLKVRALKGEPIDLVLLDYHMPAMSGLDVARAIARLGLTPKIIALTSSIDRRLTQEPNIQACSVKPIRRGQLLHMIRAVITPQQPQLPTVTSPTSSSDSIASATPEPDLITSTEEPPRHKRKFFSSNAVSAEASSLPQLPPITASPHEEGAFLAGSCILVAEDNDTNRKVVSHFLEQARCQVVEAVNGVEAVDKLSDKVAAVLMDVHMPILDGIAATRLLLKMRPSLPIVFLTADITEETRLRCTESGAVNILLKPISKGSLMAALSIALQNSPVSPHREIEAAAPPVLHANPDTFNFQRAAASASKDRVTAGVPALRASSFRCMIVDDIYTNRIMAEHMVRKVCHNDVQILLADHGEAALKQLAEQPVDLVLLDVKMPGMNGIEVTRRMRELQLRRSPKIVGLTGLDDVATIKECKTAGMDFVLLKPLREEQLQPVINHTRAAQSSPGLLRRSTPTTAPPELLFDPRLTRDLPAQVRVRLLQDWRGTTQHHISLMRTLVPKKDWESLEHVAHTMKGSSAQLGLNRVSHCAAVLVSCVGTAPRDPQQLSRLIEELDQVLDATLAHLSTVEPGAVEGELKAQKK